MRLCHIVYVLASVAEAGYALSPSRVISERNTDWSISIVESTMARKTPDKIGGWGYISGLYMLGQYQVYKRTGDPRYLSYIQEWADRFVDDSGHLNSTLERLDSMQAGNVLLFLHKETGESRYKTAATQIRDRLKTYPRTKDHGFAHFVTREHQLWADGVFMVNPFLARYGAAYDESDYTDDETTHQLIVYGNHLQVSNGLLQHAYDEAREQVWADSETGLSAEQWCRAMGWYGMAMTDILEIIPRHHPNRRRILDKLRRFVAGVKRYQDPKSGRWFQVVNKGDLEDNWTETSCSAMFTNTISTALDRGYIRDHHGEYRKVMERGYAGVMERVQKNSEGLTDVLEICVGTDVGDLQWYLERPRATNDQHGLGAVLLMIEQVAHG